MGDVAVATKAADPDAAVRDVVMRKRVDQAFARASGSYVLPDGATAAAAPHFRIKDGFSGPAVTRGGSASSEAVRDHLRKLAKASGALTPELARVITNASYGRATPKEVQQLTQMLIDSGELKKTAVRHPELKKPEEQVRMLQWDHGLGLDCGGYTQNAFVETQGASRKQLGLDPKVTNENMQHLSHNPRFAKVGGVAAARPGDVFVLGKDKDETGHVVLVRDQRELSAAERKSASGLADFAAPGEKVRLLEVDSSFGAGEEGALTGGVQRAQWLFNEKTRAFAILRDGVVFPQPAGTVYGGHPFVGIFRAKE